jgi:hypothetical protein
MPAEGPEREVRELAVFRSHGSRGLPGRDRRRAPAVRNAVHQPEFRRRYVLTKNMAIGSARISLA